MAILEAIARMTRMYREWLAANLSAMGHGAKKALAQALGVDSAVVTRMIQGVRRINADELPKMAAFFGKPLPEQGGERAIVPIMGFVGAGSEIEPDFEQVPPEGLDQIELPFPLPDEMIGFEVRGDSMLPKYEAGDVVVVYREQRRSTDSMVGDNVAVRTVDGRRFIKRLLFGPKPNTYNLESFNARTIEAVRIVWASTIFATLHRSQVARRPVQIRDEPTGTPRPAVRAR